MGQPMTGPMGGQMGMPAQGGMAPGPVGIGYYSNALPHNPYGMQVDSNGVRYAIMPEIDPRIILANRQKKVPIPNPLYLPSIVSKRYSADHRNCGLGRKSSAGPRPAA